VNVDSDVLLRHDSLARIAECFTRNPEIAALTGLLSKDCPHRDFFSQYKNLYMNYMFAKLPDRVSFLYGSIYAIRRREVESICSFVKLADDTELGQKLFMQNKPIAFLRELEVTHVKRYGFVSFVLNDFQIPLDWARIFYRNKGWRQLGKSGTGFAHSPKSQIASVILAPLVVAGIPLSFAGFGVPAAGFFLVWGAINFRLISFFAAEKGLLFGLSALFVTFMDNIVMAAGIFSGFMAEIFALNVKVGEKAKRDV